MSELLSSVLAWVKRYPGFTALIAVAAVVYNLALFGIVGTAAWAMSRPVSASVSNRWGWVPQAAQRSKDTPAKQGMSVKEYLSEKRPEPTLVRGLVQLYQTDVGWVGITSGIGPASTGRGIDSFNIKDNPDAQEMLGFELLRDSPEGRRLYHLLRNGSTRTMTLRMRGSMLDRIVSEN